MKKNFTNKELATAVRTFNRHIRRHKDWKSFTLKWSYTCRQRMPERLCQMVDDAPWEGWSEDPLIQIMLQNIDADVDYNGWADVYDPDFAVICEQRGMEVVQHISGEFWCVRW